MLLEAVAGDKKVVGGASEWLRRAFKPLVGAPVGAPVGAKEPQCKEVPHPRMRVVERKEVVVRHVRQNFVKKFVGEIHEGRRVARIRGVHVRDSCLRAVGPCSLPFHSPVVTKSRQKLSDGVQTGDSRTKPSSG